MIRKDWRSRVTVALCAFTSVAAAVVATAAPPTAFAQSKPSLRYDDLPAASTNSFTTYGRWSKVNLTYAFGNGTGDIAGDGERQAVRNALALWAAVTPLTFTERPISAGADIVILWGSGQHGDGNPFDGQNGVLAHAFTPEDGDAHFDDAEVWTLSTRTSGAQPIDLTTVAAHEIGHSLGLGHSGDASALMYPYYRASHRYLGSDDVAGIKALYPGGRPWLSLGGTLTADADVASWAPGRLDVVARGPNNSVWHKTYQNGWYGWVDLGGQIVGAPTAVSWGPGRIDVFGRGTDNALHHKWWNGTAWSGWESLGGTITSDPDAASWASGRLDVFARGTNNSMFHKAYQADQGGWHGWADLGGQFLGGPGAVSWGVGRIDVFGRGTDNALHHKYWNGQSWLP